LEAPKGQEAPPQLFISELVPHEKVARIVSENGLWQLTLQEIISNRDALKGGSFWLKDEEVLPPHGSYEITDLKKGVFKPATKGRLGILEWDMILQVEKYHDPHGPMSIEVCGETGRGKLIVTEAERMLEEFSGVVGRKMPASSVISTTALGDGDFLEITLRDGSKKRIYDAKEVRFIRKYPRDEGREAPK
jgi:hypothetical protein